jgi:transposase
MNHVLGIDRDQVFMISLGEMVPQDSEARVIDLFVEILPLDELGFTYTNPSKEGRPAYSPSDLLKLYLYGYRHGIRSSRKLERACEVNVEVMWLTSGLRPDDRTIARFRKENSTAIRNAFGHFVRVLKDWELVEGSTVAIDSFKIRAQNSLKNNLNRKTIDRQFNYHQEKFEDYFNALDTEDHTEKKRAEEKCEHHMARQQFFLEAEQTLEQSGEEQISLTDPDARAVVFQRTSVKVGYNIQAVSDAKNKMLIHADVLGVNDTHALFPLAQHTKEFLEVDHLTTLSDKGYTTGEQLALCAKENITTYSSPKDSSSDKNGLFNIDEFEYDLENDRYTCPAGDILNTNGSEYKKGSYTVKHYKTKACKTCGLKDQCTKNKNGRLIERSTHQEVVDNNRKRVEANPEYYRQRQQIIEHQFGTLKRQWGFTHTLVRGKPNVLTEVRLMMIIYNLKRALSIFGEIELKKRLKGLLALIFRPFPILRLHGASRNHYQTRKLSYTMSPLVYIREVSLWF